MLDRHTSCVTIRADGRVVVTHHRTWSRARKTMLRAIKDRDPRPASRDGTEFWCGKDLIYITPTSPPKEVS